jgi:hypothetical protein
MGNGSTMVSLPFLMAMIKRSNAIKKELTEVSSFFILKDNGVVNP